ncbi:MAG: GNAT family N-acetyltransferase [Actinomycetaceae bacterium]|nr:GNAT family N-acetyltransferase [Actinomycetaceae bacterium]
MVLRRAEMDDAEILVDLSIRTFTETFGDGYPPEDLDSFLTSAYQLEEHRQLLTDPEYGIWLLEDGGQAVGYVLAGPCSLPHSDVTEDDGEVKRLYILQSHQGQGWGHVMMELAINWLLRTGPRTLWLGVWSENLGAQRLYHSYGFSKAGEYYFVVGNTRDREFIFRRPA